MQNIFKTNLEKSILAKNQALKNSALLLKYQLIVDIIIKCYQSGNRIYVAGNGGSAADAQHFVAEFISKLSRDRDPIAAEALTTDSSILTAIGNDYGFDQIFSRQLKAKLQKGDVFIGISTSGKSQNILSALRMCQDLGNTSVVLSGFNGGECFNLASHCLIVPGDSTAIIQELHLVLEHSICEAVEKAIFFSNQ